MVELHRVRLKQCWRAGWETGGVLDPDLPQLVRKVTCYEASQHRLRFRWRRMLASFPESYCEGDIVYRTSLLGGVGMAKRDSAETTVFGMRYAGYRWIEYQ